MRPLALENGEVAAARHEAAAERCHCFRHDLAIFIEHRLVLDRLGGNYVGLHCRSLLNGTHLFPSISISIKCGLPDLKAAATAPWMSSAFATCVPATPMPLARSTKPSTGPVRSMCMKGLFDFTSKRCR